MGALCWAKRFFFKDTDSSPVLGISSVLGIALLLFKALLCVIYSVLGTSLLAHGCRRTRAAVPMFHFRNEFGKIKKTTIKCKSIF